MKLQKGLYNQLPQQYIIKKPQERAQRVEALTKHIYHAKGHMPGFELRFKQCSKNSFLSEKVQMI